MEIKINDRVLAFVHYNGKPLWLCGTVRQVMDVAGHIGVYLRKDYQVDGNKYIVVPKEFVFASIDAADAWERSIDKSLNAFAAAHDNDEKAWEGTALTWESIPSQSTEQDEIQCASDSEPSSTPLDPDLAARLARLNARTAQTSEPSL